MIIKHQIFIDKQLLVVKYNGTICIEEYKQHVLNIVQQPEWMTVDKILVDLRSVITNLNLRILKY